MREFYRGGCDGLKYEMLKHQCTTSFPSVGGGWEGMKFVGCHIRYVELLIREKRKVVVRYPCTARSCGCGSEYQQKNVQPQVLPSGGFNVPRIWCAISD